jgi:hypothetical protein
MDAFQKACSASTSLMAIRWNIEGPKKPQILTHHEFADLAKLLASDHMPGRFTLQAYIEPKLDARYITSFKDNTQDRLMSLRPDIDFDVDAAKYHTQ